MFVRPKNTDCFNRLKKKAPRRGEEGRRHQLVAQQQENPAINYVNFAESGSVLGNNEQRKQKSQKKFLASRSRSAEHGSPT
jgi:hypothetical protein